MVLAQKTGTQVAMKLFARLPQVFSRLRRKRRAAGLPVARVPSRPAALQKSIPLPNDLKQRLNGLRRHFRRVDIATGLAMFLGAICLLFLVQCLSDWWFDLPWLARGGFLLADGVLLAVLYRRQLDRPLRTQLSLEETALRVEKKWPQLQQCVIAAVELSEGKIYSTRGSRQLVQRMLEQARERTLKLNFREVVPTLKLRRWIFLGFVSAGVTAAFAIGGWPSSLALIERLALLNVPLPTKTIVVPITRDLIIPVGSDVEVSAQARGVIPASGRVTITYAGTPPQEFPVTVLPDKPATFSLTVHNVQNAFTYSFHLNDGHGPDFTVSARTPPSVTGVECEQIFPDYTGEAPRKLAPSDLSLLVGSRLIVRAVTADPLQSATVVLQGTNQTVDATLDPTGTHLEADLPIPAKDLAGFSIHLVDQGGVHSTNETVYPIELIPDNPPVVKVLQPAADHETITIHARPLIAFDAGDDYGVARLTIEYQVVPPSAAGQENSGAPVEVEQIPIDIDDTQKTAHYEYVLDVSAQNPPWQEGSTVNYWIEAVDNNGVTGPGVTKTGPRQFSVVSPEAKQAEILERLKANAAEINSLSDTQQKISNDVGEALPRK
jgi:hypothetical protein